MTPGKAICFFPDNSLAREFSSIEKKQRKMAELVATAALETFRDLLVEESRFLTSVGGQVEDVRNQLNRMHCLLKDADKRKERLKSESFRQWLHELRDLAIEAEQVLEIYAVEVMSRREWKDLKSLLKRFACILGECVSMHKAGKKSEHIMSRMADLTSKLDAMAAGESSSNATVDDEVELLRKTYGHEVEEHFVGMKDDIEHLSSLVTSDERSSRVISICGMGGLGKTTLARMIYQSDRVQCCFDMKAWICVSQTLRPKEIFQQMLKQLLKKETVDDLVVDDLVEQLYKIQKEKKCLVVLDDVWEAEHWNILRRCFPIAESNSKVLITSRNENVAGTEYVYKPQQLTEDECWELLQKIALSSNSTRETGIENAQQMEKVGRDIVKKCGLLPLAISIIGGILKREKNMTGWEKVRSCVDSYIRHGKGFEPEKSVARVVLDLSYDSLPYNLKPCFLYLGCFEEDQHIKVEQLYLLWIAEGLISLEEKGRGEVLRDVAERYFYELVSRCMVQMTSGGGLIETRFESCRLHDLVRELCLSKGKEEGFLEIVNKNEEEQDSTSHKAHRLVINGDCTVHYKWINPKLRALIIQRAFEFNSTNFGRFRCLKILKLVDICFENRQLPKGINKLVLLKHLSISRCNVIALPTDVCKLPHLQTLNLELIWGSEFLIPNLLYMMKNLTYLAFGDISNVRNLRGTVDGNKLKLAGLNQLETLYGFHSRKEDVMDLIKLEKLRNLTGIVVDKESLCIIVDYILSHEKQFHVVGLRVYLHSDDDISTLYNKLLLCKPISYLHINSKWCSLPVYNPMIGQYLEQLYLQNCQMVEDPMETLEKLPMLRILHLSYDIFIGTKMVCRAGGFPRLKVLNFLGLSNFVDWRVEKNAMPHLNFLKIGRCWKLKMIPDGLRFITSLTELEIIMNAKFITRIVKGGADYDKIKHIPRVVIDEW